MNYSFISFQKRWEISDETWFKLGQCKAIIHAISASPLKPSYRQKLYNVSLIKGALATTAIEGNTLSEDEVKLIHEGKKISASKEYMGIEIKNVLTALNEIRDNIIVNKSVRLLSPELIKDFHFKIGKELGEHFEAAPGQFRQNNVTVGVKYRAPDYNKVEEYIENFCNWSKNHFHYAKGQTFSTAIIQAIVTHVYIAWIHPFGDGNGRTARLLEFYILLRAGVPDIAAHILSNHYNETRSEYYRQLDLSSKNGGDLTGFIEYAIQGFKDGLITTLKIIQKNQLEIAWHNHIREVFHNNPDIGKGQIAKRRMQLILTLQMDTPYSVEQMLSTHPTLEIQYSSLSGRTLYRDIEVLKELQLLAEIDHKYYVNTDILKGTMPRSLNQIAIE